MSTSDPPPCAQSVQPEPDRGLSLIELVVAMAIFALIAVLGAQALTGMIRMRDSLEQRAEQTAALTYATSLLRTDLSAVVPMLFYPPQQASPRSALALQTGSHSRVFALSVAGQASFNQPSFNQAGFGTAGTGVTALAAQRIEWQLQDDTLSRASWPVLAPVDPAARSEPVTILSGVTDLRLRSYWPQIGWVNGLSPGQATTAPPQLGAADGDGAAVAPERYSSTLPLAIELTLSLRDFGDISLIESLK